MYFSISLMQHSGFFSNTALLTNTIKPCVFQPNPFRWSPLNNQPNITLSERLIFIVDCILCKSGLDEVPQPVYVYRRYKKRRILPFISTSFFCLFFLLNAFLTQGQSISVTSLSGSPLCAGSNFYYYFQNHQRQWFIKLLYKLPTYTVYLSSSTGGTPYTSIGTFTTTGVSYSNSTVGQTTGITKSFTMPATTASGSGYKTALWSTSPTFNGSGGSGATGTLTVNAIPVFTTQPSTSVQNICLNGAATALSITASAGSGSISGYQWYKKCFSFKQWRHINCRRHIRIVYTVDLSYRHFVLLRCYQLKWLQHCVQRFRAITINALPSITVQPSTATQSLCLNSTPTALSVTASAGSGSISGYQWYKNAAASNSGGTLLAEQLVPVTTHHRLQRPERFTIIVLLPIRMAVQSHQTCQEQ